MNQGNQEDLYPHVNKTQVRILILRLRVEKKVKLAKRSKPQEPEAHGSKRRRLVGNSKTTRNVQRPLVCIKTPAVSLP